MYDKNGLSYSEGRMNYIINDVRKTVYDLKEKKKR